MNLIFGCLLIIILILVKWSNSSYLDMIYKTMMTPRNNWPSINQPQSSHQHHRYLKSRQMQFLNPQQSNREEFLFSPNEDDYRKSFLLNERQSLVNDQHSEKNLDLDNEFRSIKNHRPQINSNVQTANNQQSKYERQEQTESQSNNCNCNPIIKTKYIAIEIPKIVKIPSDSNSQSSNTEQSSVLPSNLSSSKIEHNSVENLLLNSPQLLSKDGLVGKTRIITISEIRELPQTGLSKTLVVNTIEGKRNNHNNFKNVNNFNNLNSFNNNLRPSRVQQHMPASLTTYFGEESY